MQDALDHGIPLTFDIGLRRRALAAMPATRNTRVELRYFPLSRRYQLREVGNEDLRSFATPAYLVAALGRCVCHCRRSSPTCRRRRRCRFPRALDPAALPGALRLPALFEPAWRLAARDHAWAAP